MTTWLAADKNPMEPSHTNALASKPSFLDLDAHDARRKSRTLLSILERIGGLLHLLHGARLGAGQPLERIGQLSGAGRQLVDDGQRLPLQRVGDERAASDDDQQHQRRADRARQAHLLQPIHGRIERVEEQPPQHQRQQHRLHELQ